MKNNILKKILITLFIVTLFLMPSYSYGDNSTTTTTVVTTLPVSTTIPIPDVPPQLDDPLPTETAPKEKVITPSDLAAKEKAKIATKSLDKATQNLLDTQLKIEQTSLQIQELVAKLATLNDQIENNSAILAINEMPTAQLKSEIQYRAIKLYQDSSGEPSDDLAELYKRRVSTLANSIQSSSSILFSNFQKRIDELSKIESDLETQKAQSLTLQTELESQNTQLADDFEKAKIEYEKQSKTFLDASGSISERLPVDGKVCPIAGPLTHVDDFGNNRSGGRSHKGNDIFNASGTPNVAIVGGTTQFLDGGLGGTGIFLHGDDGNIYYYAHLLSRVGEPRRVAIGELIAYTGATGNAAGGAPHTHFEIRLGGTVHVNPYPILRIICGV